MMIKQRAPQFGSIRRSESMKQGKEFLRTDSIETIGEALNPFAYMPPKLSIDGCPDRMNVYMERMSEMSSHTDDSQAEEISVPTRNGLQISGFLLKKSKEGAWQRRYFETNGPFLTYYKTKKKSKLLAALNLVDVDDIYEVQ